MGRERVAGVTEIDVTVRTFCVRTAEVLPE
jgi:hypothetical protein